MKCNDCQYEFEDGDEAVCVATDVITVFDHNEQEYVGPVLLHTYLCKECYED